MIPAHEIHPPTSTGQSFVWASVGRIMLAIHDETVPPDDAWFAYAEMATRQLREVPRTVGLTLTTGGTPNAKQRGYVRVQLQGRMPRIAVVSTARSVNMFVLSMRLINNNLSAFHPQSFGAAMVFLGLDDVEQQIACQTIADLSRNLRRNADVDVLLHAAATHSPSD